MKLTKLHINIKISVLILLAFNLSVLSCSKDSYDDDPKVDYGYIAGKINNSQIELKALGATLYNGKITISGLNCDFRNSISITFPSHIGTFPIEDNGEAYMSYTIGDNWLCGDDFSSTNQTNYIAVSGEISITEINNEMVKGSFSFVGKTYDDVEISFTGGQIDVLINN